MKNFVKGDYRKHGPLQNRPTACSFLGEKQGFPEPATGPNRKARRRVKAMTRYSFLKGVSGAKILRRMVKSQGLRETIMLMNGVNRGVKRHPGYPTRGDYDRTGGRLASPRKS